MGCAECKSLALEYERLIRAHGDYLDELVSRAAGSCALSSSRFQPTNPSRQHNTTTSTTSKQQATAQDRRDRHAAGQHHRAGRTVQKFRSSSNIRNSLLRYRSVPDTEEPVMVPVDDLAIMDTPEGK